ncbi:glycosyltransferase [Brevibacillus gelatini]|uniref:LysM peptidoglycan-binding domain-containing protein n=1 Tax=Brevibacillus gelatini TaxID=1655277 RepID=A0A3M8B1Q1_9BACL|nr:glycosyltransferase [Brevibacillus gelatini]RNB57386.1 LysM peptidoglycan-binding domain-containing protein [Brevibacillus gelatini]
MRVLFLESHPMWIHGLPNGFRDSGHDVMISGPLTEQNIPEMLQEFQPDLIVMIGWGPEQTPVKLDWIHRHVHQTDVPLVYWATEDPTFTESFTMPLIQRVQPDFVFTICSQRLDYYAQRGIKAAHMDFGFHSSIHCPVPIEERYRTSIAVVANAYPHVFEQYTGHYRLVSLFTLIRPLLHEGIRIDFYGRDWDKMKPYLGLDIPKEWIHGYLSYPDAHKVYSSAEIMIGLQNYETQLTQRTYEILGSGGFLVTQDTEAVRSMFTSGKDLVAAASATDTLQIIEHYLQHPKERKEIREQGRLAVRHASYQHRAEYMVEVLQAQGLLPQSIATAAGQGQWISYMDRIRERYEVHDVRPGDTLWKIAQTYGVTIEHIMKENGLTSYDIYVDQYLKIRERQP